MNEASDLIAQLAAGHADELDKTMEEGEHAFAAMTVLWTTEGVRWRTAAGQMREKKTGAVKFVDEMKLVNELRQAVRETRTRGVGRIGNR